MPRPQFSPKSQPPTKEEINGLRAASGLTMPQLASLLEVSPASVENWCAGRYPMPRPIWQLMRILCADRYSFVDAHGECGMEFDPDGQYIKYPDP